MDNGYNYLEDKKELAQDLRTIYANDIVGDSLKDIMDARKSDRYNYWFECLQDLYVVIAHKFKEKDNNKQEKDYQQLIRQAIILANKHPQVWLGATKDPIASEQIKHSLRQIEMFLYQVMEDANMFGSNKKIAGL